jgi:hypothetical protein
MTNLERQVIPTLILYALTSVEQATDAFTYQESANAYAEGTDGTEFSRYQR